ncbi:MAG: hypothetical protein ABFR62_03535 [Bacteroidota bacterium]
MKIKFFTLLSITLFSLTAFSQSKHETVVELLGKTGSTEQIKQFDAIFEAQAAAKKSSFKTEEDFQKFNSIMKSGLNSKDAEKYIIEYFELNSNEDSLKKVISIYDNPLMKEFNKVELEANDPKNQQEQIAFFQNMQNNPPSQERIQQLVTLNNELGTSEMLVNLLNNVVLAMIKGVNYSMPNKEQISQEEIKNRLNESLPADFSQQMTNQIIAMSLYTYKDISDEKLDEYIKIWESPIGKYYISQMFGAFDYSFSKMGKNIGKSFTTLTK